MKKYYHVCCLFTVVLSLGGVYAAATPGNCRESLAPQITISDSVQNLTLLREWNVNGGGGWIIDPATHQPIEVPATGAWLDGQPDTADPAVQVAGYWTTVSLQRGKDYVFSFSDDTVGFLFVDRKTAAFIDFRSEKVDGVNYRYVNATDWSQFDPETVDFYVHVSGGVGNVGQKFVFQFKQMAIRDILPVRAGSVASPYEIDVSKSGDGTIGNSPERHYGRLSSVYRANLRAGEKYVFTALPPSGVTYVTFALPEGCPVDASAVKLNPKQYEMSEIVVLEVEALKDYSFMFIVRPDQNHYSDSVSGGILSWQVGDKHDPAPEWVGTFRGKLTDLEKGNRLVAFSAIAMLMDDGSTNFSMTATIDGVKCAYTNCGHGVVLGETRINDKTYDSLFGLTLLDDGKVSEMGKLRISGSIFLPGDEGVLEFFFEGILDGGVIPWDSSFYKFDPQVSSAAAMGISSGPFANELAGSVTLTKLHSWGCANNIEISMTQGMVFTQDGDPVNSLAEAYLLNCAPTETAIEAEKSGFVITAFDLVNGVTVSGGKSAGDTYGNGRIEVRTSESIGGSYTAIDKKPCQCLFFKAYLVK